MPSTRVLVVDDSVVVRRLVTKALETDPDIEVAGVAANGHIALAKVAQLDPDLVVLDIEMPEMDGLEALKHLRQTHPRLPVIMFSSLTHRGASATLDALSLGASDYLAKPKNTGSMTDAVEAVASQLIPKIKSLCGATGRITASTGIVSPVEHAPVSRRRTSLARRAQAVVIGVSTGGPNALAELLPRLPADFPVPLLVVQHMPPTFTGLLAQRLDGKCPLRVAEAVAGEAVSAGTVWIAPGDYHMTVHRNGTQVQLGINQDPPENSCRPAADVLFRSAAEVWGAELLSVVMTGMGSDGLRGVETISQAGGQVLAQDEASSVVWGMPGYVVRAELADAVLPLAELAGEIVRRSAPIRVLSGARRTGGDA